MKRSLIKLTSVVLGLGVLSAAISMTDAREEGWLTAFFLLFIFVGIPLLILTWVDFGRHLRAAKNPTALVKTLAFIFTVPQVLFAIFAIICGITLTGWVTYNSLIKRVPEYTGGFLTFGIGPALISFGVLWLRQARFRRPAGSSHRKGAMKADRL